MDELESVSVRVLHGLCTGWTRPHHTRNRQHHNRKGYGVTLYPSDMRCCYGVHGVVKTPQLFSWQI